MDFKKSQLMKTMCILRGKDCPKTDGKHQLKRTWDKIRGKK